MPFGLVISSYLGASFLTAILAFLWGDQNKIFGAGIMLASILIYNVLSQYVFVMHGEFGQTVGFFIIQDLILASLFFTLRKSDIQQVTHRWAIVCFGLHGLMVLAHLAKISIGAFAPGHYAAFLNVLAALVLISMVVAFTPKSLGEAKGVLKAKLLYLRLHFSGFFRERTVSGPRVEQMPKSDDERLVTQHIGERIRQARIIRQMSRDQLGEKVGLSGAQIERYEHGKNRVSAPVLYHLSQVLDVDVAEFFEGLSAEGEPGMIRVRRP
ncbi:MAG: helix-turn-helix transcriptional regulator [Pseudomonadota bacterium]